MGEHRSRQDLENVAFGDGSSPAERNAALRRLAALRAGEAQAAVVIPESDEGFGVEPGEPMADPPAPRRRWFVAAAMVAAALVVGAGIGSSITAHGGSGAGGASASSPTAAASVPDAANGAQFVDGAADPVSHANALLKRKQVAADEYPTTFDLNETFVPSSTRLVGTAGSNVRIYIARQVGSTQGFCLLSATLQTTGDQSSGSATCASPKDFAANGLTLGEGTFNATWVAGTVELNVGVLQ